MIFLGLKGDFFGLKGEFLGCNPTLLQVRVLPCSGGRGWDPPLAPPGGGAAPSALLRRGRFHWKRENPTKMGIAAGSQRVWGREEGEEEEKGKNPFKKHFFPGKKKQFCTGKKAVFQEKKKQFSIKKAFLQLFQQEKEKRSRKNTKKKARKNGKKL